MQRQLEAKGRVSRQRAGPIRCDRPRDSGPPPVRRWRAHTHPGARRCGGQGPPNCARWPLHHRPLRTRGSDDSLGYCSRLPECCEELRRMIVPLALVFLWPHYHCNALCFRPYPECCVGCHQNDRLGRQLAEVMACIEDLAIGIIGSTARPGIHRHLELHVPPVPGSNISRHSASLKAGSTRRARCKIAPTNVLFRVYLLDHPERHDQADLISSDLFVPLDIRRDGVLQEDVGVQHRDLSRGGCGAGNTLTQIGREQFEVALRSDFGIDQWCSRDSEVTSALRMCQCRTSGTSPRLRNRRQVLNCASHFQSTPST